MKLASRSCRISMILGRYLTLVMIAVLLPTVVNAATQHSTTAPDGQSTLGDFVWHDLDADGLQDVGEPGINGVTVELWLDNPDEGSRGIFEPGIDQLVESMETQNRPGTTNPGWYDFEVTFGPQIIYFVRIPPAEFEPTGTLAGYKLTSLDTFGSNPQLVFVSSSQDDYNLADFGFARIGLTLEKSVYAGHNNGASCPGAETVTGGRNAAITFCFAVTNSGQDTFLDDITITDPLLGLNAATLPVASGSLPLAPGATVLFYRQTTLTESVQNRADATGTPYDAQGNELTGAERPTDSDTANQQLVIPAVKLNKTVYQGHSSGAGCPGSDNLLVEEGADITYCFVVINQGNTFLSTIEIDDPDIGIDETDMTRLRGVLPLAPGSSVVYYYETQATDLLNEATARGVPTNGQGVPVPGTAPVDDEDWAEVTAVAPALTLSKTVYLGHDGYQSCPGDETLETANGAAITYCFIVTNTGNTFLDDVKLTDPQLSIDQTDMTLVSGSEPLAPQATLVLAYETTLQGTLQNVASAVGNPVDDAGTDLPGIDSPMTSDAADVIGLGAGVRVVKSVYAGDDQGASCPGGQTLAALNGAPVSYCFEVTNVGDTYLNDVTVDDADLSIDQDDMTLSAGSLPLAPGEALLYYYVATVDGDLENRADTSAQPSDEQGNALPDVEPVTDTDTAEVLEIAPGVEIVKSVYFGHDGGAQCPGAGSAAGVNGTLLTYCFDVINTGDTYLDPVTIDDPILAIDQADMDLLAGVFPLAPAARALFYYETDLQRDIVNTALVEGRPSDADGKPLPGAQSVSDSDSATVDASGPAVDLNKTVYAGHDAGSGCPGAESIQSESGAAITYCFAVTNTGDTYLDQVDISDPTLGLSQSDLARAGGEAFVAPGATVIYYYETAALGALENIAVVRATPTDENGKIIPGLPLPVDLDSAVVTLPDTGAVGNFVWKDLNGDGIQDPDEPGFPNVTVTLYDRDQNQVAQTTTNANGFYRFADLTPGEYFLIFDLPDGMWAFSPRYQGGDPNKDSNATPETGWTDSFILEPGQIDNSQDAGIYPPSGLRMTKTANTTSVRPGGSLVYVLVYRNIGEVTARDVLIIETVPEHTIFDADKSTPGWDCADGAAAGTECVLKLGDVPAGDATDPSPVQFAVIVDSTIPNNVAAIRNTAMIGEESPDRDGTLIGAAVAGIDVPLPPTAVTLESFNIRYDGEKVTLEWVTSAEVDTLGFHIYRSIDGTRESAAIITRALIPGQGGNGGVYSFVDDKVFGTFTFTYWLVETEISGRQVEYIPVSVTLKATESGHDVYLPMVLNR